MKKEIMNALKAKEATVKINEICTLHRWTKDALGDEVDRLTVSFPYIVGIKGGKEYDIVARDYNGIIYEISECMGDYLTACAEEAAKNLRAGYR